jgi:VanZ family protein
MSGRNYPRLAASARLAFWPLALFAAFMAFDPRPPRIGIEQFGDKFSHMLAFLVLTAVAQLAFARTPRWQLAERLSFFGALIEVVQSIPALHRDCDIKDWIADTVVIVAVTAGFILADRRAGERRDA